MSTLSGAGIVFAVTTAIVACQKNGTKDNRADTTDGPAVIAPDGGGNIPPAAMPTTEAGAEADRAPEPARETLGELAIGTIKPTSGTLPNGERIMRAVRPRLRNCYTRGLVTNKSMQGKVTLAIKVAPTGEVLESKVVENQGIDALPAGCMAAVLKKVAFEPPGGAGASFSVQLTCSLPNGGATDGGE